MREEKEELFQEEQFARKEDTVEELKTHIASFRNSRLAIILSVLVPLIDCSLTYLLSPLQVSDEVIFCAWIAVAIIVYLLCGGLLPALQMVWKATYTTYCLVPIFPLDLFLGAWVFLISGIIALFLPVIIVLWNRYMTK